MENLKHVCKFKTGSLSGSVVELQKWDGDLLEAGDIKFNTLVIVHSDPEKMQYLKVAMSFVLGDGVIHRNVRGDEHVRVYILNETDDIPKLLDAICNRAIELCEHMAEYNPAA